MPEQSTMRIVLIVRYSDEVSILEYHIDQDWSHLSNQSLIYIKATTSKENQFWMNFDHPGLNWCLWCCLSCSSMFSSVYLIQCICPIPNPFPNCWLHCHALWRDLFVIWSVSFEITLCINAFISNWFNWMRIACSSSKGSMGVLVCLFRIAYK